MNADDPRHGTVRGYRLGCRLHCCRRAKSVANAEQGRRERGGDPPRHSLPWEPLDPYWPRLIDRTHYRSELRLALEKARTRGFVSVHTADRAAIAIGLHPALIWGDAWWVKEDAA